MLKYSALLLLLFFFIFMYLVHYMFLIVLSFIPSVPDGPRFILLIPPLCCSSVPRVLSLHLSCCTVCVCCLSHPLFFIVLSLISRCFPKISGIWIS